MRNFRSIIILLSFYLSAAFVVHWGVNENFGYLKIMSDQTLDIQFAEESIDCAGFPCRLKVVPGSYNLRMQELNSQGKPQYYRVNIKRGRLAKVAYKAKKNYQLLEGELSPVVVVQKTSAGTMLKDYKKRIVARFNQKYADLKVKTNFNHTRAVVYSVSQQDMYLLNLETLSKQKFKVGVEFSDAQLIDKESILIQTPEGVYLLDGENKLLQFYESINYILNLDADNSLVISPNSLTGSLATSTDITSLINRDQKQKDYYLYRYNNTEDTYYYLNTLKNLKPEQIQLKYGLVNGKVYSNLILKGKSFMIKP